MEFFFVIINTFKTDNLDSYIWTTTATRYPKVV